MAALHSILLTGLGERALSEIDDFDADWFDDPPKDLIRLPRLAAYVAWFRERMPGRSGTARNAELSGSRRSHFEGG